MAFAVLRTIPVLKAVDGSVETYTLHLQPTVTDVASIRASAAVDTLEWPIAAAGEPARPRVAATGEDSVRRLVEIGIAVVALALLWPLMLIVAVIVKFDTPGPALFRQSRVGLNGRRFTFYKFRTLYADARQRFPELYAYRYSAEEIRTLKFKREADPRVTPAGRWLRKSTLDELPNFWNLLRGDIALVGPRPEIPEMLPHYLPEQLVKFSVRPGITGLAQTHGRGNLSFQDTIAYDLEYVRRRSVLLDIRLIFRTMRMLLKLDGAF